MTAPEQNYAARSYRSLNRDMAGWFIAVGIGILSIIFEVVFHDNWLATLAAWAFVIQLAGLIVQYLVMQLLENGIRKKEDARAAAAAREEPKRPRLPIIKPSEPLQAAMEAPSAEDDSLDREPSLAHPGEAEPPRREAPVLQRDAEPARRTDEPREDELQRRGADAIQAALGARLRLDPR